MSGSFMTGNHSVGACKGIRHFLAFNEALIHLAVIKDINPLVNMRDILHRGKHLESK